MRRKENLLWVVYAAFLAWALATGWHDELLVFGGRLGGVKALIWAAFAAFLAFSLYCSTRESLLGTVVKLNQLHWGRQIGTDLYLGLALALLVIYLNEGAGAALLWALPTLAFANLAVLPYFAIHFEELTSKLLGG